MAAFPPGWFDHYVKLAMLFENQQVALPDFHGKGELQRRFEVQKELEVHLPSLSETIQKEWPW